MRKVLLPLAVVFAALGALLLIPRSTPANAQSETAPQRDSVSLTIYNQGTALVQDRRTFTLEAGENIVNFTDVAALIDPTSVTFSSLTNPAGTFVLEQNYVYDLVDSSALLNRYLDEQIQVTMMDGTVYTGQLLSGRGGEIILRTSEGQVQVLALSQARDIRFPNLPDGLITRPTLRWVIQSDLAGEQQVELTYLTAGISWTADYNLLLATNNQSLDINGWVTLSNVSGTAFQDAQVKLVAGDVNRISDQVVMDFAQEERAVAAGAPAEPQTVQREFFEYQLYELVRRVTVGNNETKQVEFVAATSVKAQTFFAYDSSAPFYGYGYTNTDPYYGQTGITTVQNWLEFSTGEESGLDADLPAGRVRVFQEDTDGAALLIGENTISHTPNGESVRFYLGNAFDLVGQRTQTDFRLLSDTVLQESYEIRLRNRKDDETVTIRVPERLARWSNWEILASSHLFVELNAFMIEFSIDVPPGEEVVLTYTVQYSWPR